MPEDRGPSPEQSGVEDKNRQEAEALGLTNAEYARYRLTDELPVRIEQLNRRTFRDQTGRSVDNPFGFTKEEGAAIKGYLDEKYGRTSEPAADAPGAPESPAEPEIELEPAPPMPDYERFKPWGLQEIGLLGTEIGQILEGDGDALPSAQVFKRAERFTKVYHGYRESGTLAYNDRDPDVPPAIAAIWPLVDEVLARPDLPLGVRTDLVDGLTQVQNRDEKGLLPRKLHENMEATGRPELAVQLLGREGEVKDDAAEAISRVLNRSKNMDLVNETGRQAILPLIDHIKNKGYIYPADVHAIEVIVADIGATEETVAEAKARDLTFEQISNSFVDAFKPETESGRILPHHGTIGDMLKLLDRLSIPKHGEPPAVSAGLPDLLERIYTKRVVGGYEDHPDVKAFAPHFNKLAAACGIDRRISTD